MTALYQQHCQACFGSEEALSESRAHKLRAHLHPDWQVIDGHHLQRRIDFDDFAQALRFTNALGAVAEEEQHHPDILLQYGAATVTIFTHTLDGLSEADFVLAAKADRLLG